MTEKLADALFNIDLSHVFDQLPHGVTIQNRAGKVIYANAPAAQLVGCASAKEMLRTPPEQILEKFILWNESNQKINATTLPGRKTLKTRKPHQEIVRFQIVKTGKEYWSLVQSQPLFDARKKFIGVTNSFNDLTQMKRTAVENTFLAEVSAALSSSMSYETRLNRLAELVVPAIADWCAIDMINAEGDLERVKITPPDLEKPKLTLKTPLVARGKKLGELLLGMSDSHRKFTPEDKKFIERFAHKVAILADNARLHSILEQQMKKQRNFREALVKSEKTLKIALQTGRMKVWDFPIDRVDITQPYQEFLNEVHQDDREHVADQIELAMARLEKFEVEFRLQPEDHEAACWILGKGQILGNDAGQPIRLVGIGMDITERKIEEKRSEHFLTITSHELKSPLTVIKSISQLLKKQLKDTAPNSVEYLTKIDIKVDLLARLVNDLLDVTRIRQGKLEFLYEVIDFSQLLEEVIEEVRFQAKKYTITVEGKLTREVIADRDRLAQVIRNLLWNAVKYSPQSFRIVVKVLARQKSYTVQVQDFGQGIPAEHQQKIFELYYRSGGEKGQSQKGLGVGLYISSEIIKQHGGKMSVKSLENKGTTFSFTLPFIPKRISDTGESVAGERYD